MGRCRLAAGRRLSSLLKTRRWAPSGPGADPPHGLSLASAGMDDGAKVLILLAHSTKRVKRRSSSTRVGVIGPSGAMRECLAVPRSLTKGGTLRMTQDLAYDMMLEAQGLIRSFGVRMSLDRELRIGETFSMTDRRWVVTRVHAASSEGVDRRVIARELVEPVPPAV